MLCWTTWRTRQSLKRFDFARPLNGPANIIQSGIHKSSLNSIKYSQVDWFAQPSAENRAAGRANHMIYNAFIYFGQNPMFG